MQSKFITCEEAVNGNDIVVRRRNFKKNCQSLPDDGSAPPPIDNNLDTTQAVDTEERRQLLIRTAREGSEVRKDRAIRDGYDTIWLRLKNFHESLRFDCLRCISMAVDFLKKARQCICQVILS